MTLAARIEARKPQPEPRRVPEWLKRRQEKQAEARDRFGTDHVADRVLA